MHIQSGSNTSPFMNGIPYNTQKISQKQLNIDLKKRTSLFPWNGQFSPQLIEVLLDNYATNESVIFDPFVGSGTLLAECASRNLVAMGTEINPAAYQFASTFKYCCKDPSIREKIIRNIELSVEKIMARKTIINSYNADLSDDLLKHYKSLRDKDTRHFFETLLILLDCKNKEVSEKRLTASWDKLKKIIVDLPRTNTRQIAFNEDARRTSLESSTIDLVISSPPYINVFNYHQNYRSISELLGHNILEVAKSEIGSNRKNRGNRFLTVVQYILDMTDVFTELHRVCSKNARVIFVVGRESNVRKTRFLNSEIITKIASRCARFDPIERQERVFLNRYGENIHEDIIHFKLSRSPRILENPHTIALETLSHSKNYAPTGVVYDIGSAIDKVFSVNHSPLLKKTLQGI